jgi:transposase
MYAAKLLNKSKRTIERYLQQYYAMGIQFIIHKNKGKSSANKIPDSLKQKVQHLIKIKYFDLNLAHLKEKLAENEDIQVKRETLRKWAHQIHHVKRAKKRRVKVRKRRDRMDSAGLMLQMDGSPHQWFGHEKSCLKVLKAVIEEKGVFKTLYVDRAGIFGGPKRCNFSQVQRACSELCIPIGTNAYSIMKSMPILLAGNYLFLRSPSQANYPWLN